MAVFEMELLLAYKVTVEAKDHTEAEEIANEDLDNFLGIGDVGEAYGSMTTLVARVMKVDWKTETNAGSDSL